MRLQLTWSRHGCGNTLLKKERRITMNRKEFYNTLSEGVKAKIKASAS